MTLLIGTYIKTECIYHVIKITNPVEYATETKPREETGINYYNTKRKMKMLETQETQT